MSETGEDNKIRILDLFDIRVHHRGELISDYIRRDHLWEGESTMIMKSVFESCSPDNTMFLDVGANMGYYTLLSAVLGIETLSIEPIPLNLDLMKQSLSDQPHLEPRIKISEVAVSDAEGSIEMSYYNFNMGLSRFREGTTWGKDGIKVTVPVKTLDSLMSDFDSNCSSVKEIICKIDVEESELPVLKGMDKILKSGRIKYMLIEISPSKDPYSGLEVCERLRMFGQLDKFNLVENLDGPNMQSWSSLTDDNLMRILCENKQINMLFWK